MDNSLAVVRERVIQARDRIATAAITSAEIQRTLTDWAKREVSERLALRLKAEERSEQLATALLQVNQWLEVAESSASLVQGMLFVGDSPNDSSGATIVDPLVEQLSSLRVQSAAAMEIVTSIQDRIAGVSDEKSLADRVQRAVQLALRVLATVGTLQSRLDDFANRMPATQTQLQELKSSTQRWISLARIVGSLLMILMATGQLALCWVAWNGRRRAIRNSNVNAALN